MHEHRGAAAIELLEQRLVARIAEVDAVGVALGGDAVGAELVDRVLELGQRPVDVGQRQGGEVAEMLRMGAPDLGARVVDVAAQLPRRGVVAEVRAG